MGRSKSKGKGETMKTIPIEEMKNGYDWQHAFHEACLGHCKPYDAEDIGPVKNVSEVITCSAGQNDEAEWIAVVGWGGPEGSFAVMRAGCDYTGWDCQAGGKIEFYKTREEALSPNTLTAEERERLGIAVTVAR